MSVYASRVVYAARRSGRPVVAARPLPAMSLQFAWRDHAAAAYSGRYYAWARATRGRYVSSCVREVH